MNTQLFVNTTFKQKYINGGIKMKTNTRKHGHDKVSMALIMSFCLIALVAIFTVKAACQGTVSKVYKDDNLGYTIEITHTNGYMSKYCNLTKEVQVEEGDTVAKGASIGKVGTSASIECDDPPHLHLEISKDGHLLDPKELINF